jgi:hypothetical protein
MVMAEENQQIPSTWVPTPKQAAVLEAALEPGVDRNHSAICRAAKVDRGSLRVWLRDDPDFRDAWAKLWRESLERHASAITASLVQNAIGGDVQAQRLFFDLKGDLKNRHEHSGPNGAPLVDEASLVARFRELVRDPAPPEAPSVATEPPPA